MVPPYLYFTAYNLINQEEKEKMDSLLEKLYLEEKTSWALLMSHTSDKKEQKALTCKKGCCKWSE
jgi:hypothetical protein